MPRLDAQTVLVVIALLVLGYWVFNKSNASGGGGKAQWGPLAGSGPGIHPDLAVQACPAHQEQSRRDGEPQEVSAYNPASFDFASVQ